MADEHGIEVNQQFTTAPVSSMSQVSQVLSVIQQSGAAAENKVKTLTQQEDEALEAQLAALRGHSLAQKEVPDWLSVWVQGRNHNAADPARFQEA